MALAPPPPPTRTALAAYQVARLLVLGVSRALWRVEVEGAELVPATGACIIAPVHRSNIDTLVVSAVSRRRLRYMGKEGVFSFPPFRWLLSALGGFPVRRGVVDREALRRCQAVLAGGEPLVLFPEGQRCSGPTVQPIYEGAAYLAARAGVPIVPVGIAGSERAMAKGVWFPRPTKVFLHVGAPLAPPSLQGGRVSREWVKAATNDLIVALQTSFDAARRHLGEPVATELAS